MTKPRSQPALLHIKADAVVRKLKAIAELSVINFTTMPAAWCVCIPGECESGHRAKCLDAATKGLWSAAGY